MKDIQKKNDGDLATHVSEKREELRKLRFSTAGSGIRNVKSIHNTKKELARSLTEQNARRENNNA